MSRRISNPQLAELLKAAHMALHDLAAIVGVHPRSLLRYSRGRPLPILERRLARVLHVSIPDLRDLLGIHQLALRRPRAMPGDFARQNRSKNYEQIIFNEATDSLSTYNAATTIYRWSGGRGRYVNGGARYAAYQGFQSFVAIAQSVPRACIMHDRRGKFWVMRITHKRRCA